MKKAILQSKNTPPLYKLLFDDGKEFLLKPPSTPFQTVKNEKIAIWQNEKPAWFLQYHPMRDAGLTYDLLGIEDQLVGSLIGPNPRLFGNSNVPRQAFLRVAESINTQTKRLKIQMFENQYQIFEADELIATAQGGHIEIGTSQVDIQKMIVSYFLLKEYKKAFCLEKKRNLRKK